MSQINTNAILDASGGTTATVNGFTPTVSNMAGRNRIINGDMRIDQRNAGASVTPAASTYTLDRFKVEISQASKLSVQQNAGAVTPPTGFTNYLGITSTSAYSLAAGDFFLLSQRIEGFNVSDLGWGTANAAAVTLSFRVRSSLTGTFGGVFTNSAQDRSYPFTYTIAAANTWTTISVSIAGDTSGTWVTNNGVGLFVYFGLGVGPTYGSGTAGAWAAGNIFAASGCVSVVGTSGATFYITGVQLEAGSVATSFEHRHYEQELALCARYYWQRTLAEQGIRYVAFAGVQNTGSIQTMISMPATMRVDPTVSASSFAQNNLGATPTAVSGTTFNGNSLRLGLTVSGATTNNVGNVSVDVTLNSEL